MIKKFLFRLIGNLWPSYAHKKICYSQEGEDLIVQQILKNLDVDQGFYIDIGAHHPFRFSNTALLHDSGWRGINIEASPDLIKSFKMYRKNDINLNVGVGAIDGKLDFYRFREQAYNTFSSERMKFILKDKVDLRDIVTVEVIGIGKLLSELRIDFSLFTILNIDIEGYDEEVILNLDLSNNPFNLVLCEDHGRENLEPSAISDHLASHNYNLVAMTTKTYLYLRR